MEVSVNRLISQEGLTLDDEVISSDFYAPMPKIELHSLKKESQQNSNHVNEGSGFTARKRRPFGIVRFENCRNHDNQDENEGPKKSYMTKAGILSSKGGGEIDGYTEKAWGFAC